MAAGRMLPAEPGRRLLMLLRILTMNVQNDEGDARRQKALNAGLRAIAPDCDWNQSWPLIRSATSWAT